MTLELTSASVLPKLGRQFESSIVAFNEKSLLVKKESLVEIASFLKNAKGLEFNYLSNITATDYFDYFELVYQLLSLDLNHSLILRTRVYERDMPYIPSLVSLYQGADFQEREIYDLLGIRFTDHPHLKRIFLWEGFQGYPLRKDFLG